MGINESYFAGPVCPGPITLDGDQGIVPQCQTGWTTFTNSDPLSFITFANAASTTTPLTPQTRAGTNGTMYYFGGSWDGQKLALRTIWEDNGPNWETLLPVYQDNCPAGEPWLPPGGGSGLPPAWGQQIPIVGYASVIISGIPDFTKATITFQCNVFSTGRSGDLNDANLNFYGTRGSVPLLVQ